MAHSIERERTGATRTSQTDGADTREVHTIVEFPDLAVNLIYTVLCLVPGFVTFQTLVFVSGLDRDMTEFEQATWSLVGSGISLSLLYFVYVAWSAVVTGRFALVRSIDLGWVDLVAAYPILLVVAMLLGFVGAKVLVWTVGVPAGTGHEAGQ